MGRITWQSCVTKHFYMPVCLLQTVYLVTGLVLLTLTTYQLYMWRRYKYLNIRQRKALLFGSFALWILTYEIYNFDRNLQIMYYFQFFSQSNYFLILVFIYARKAIKSTRNTRHLRILAGVYWALTAFYTGILIYNTVTLFQEGMDQKMLCKDDTWTYIRITSFLLSIAFVFVGKHMSQKINEIEQLFRPQESAVSTAEPPLMLQDDQMRIKTHEYNIWLLIKVNLLAQIAYQAMNMFFLITRHSDPSIKNCDYIQGSQYPDGETWKQWVEGLISLSQKVLCIFLPLSCQLYVFWIKKPSNIVQESRYTLPEDFQRSYFGIHLQLKYNTDPLTDQEDTSVVLSKAKSGSNISGVEERSGDKSPSCEQALHSCVTGINSSSYDSHNNQPTVRNTPLQINPPTVQVKAGDQKKHSTRETDTLQHLNSQNPNQKSKKPQNSEQKCLAGVELLNQIAQAQPQKNVFNSE